MKSEFFKFQLDVKYLVLHEMLLERKEKLTYRYNTCPDVIFI